MKRLVVIFCITFFWFNHFFSLKLNDLPPEILQHIGLFLHSDIPMFDPQIEVFVMPDSENFEELSKQCQPCSFFRDEKIRSLFRKYYDSYISPEKKFKIMYCRATDARGGYSSNKEKVVIAFYMKETSPHVRPVLITGSGITLFDVADESIIDSFNVKGKVESLTVTSDGGCCIYCLAPARDSVEKTFKIILYDFLSEHRKRITSFTDGKLGNLSLFHHCSVPYRPLVSLTCDDTVILCIPQLETMSSTDNKIQFTLQVFQLVRRDNALEAYFREELVCTVFPQKEVATVIKGGRVSLPIMILWSKQRKVTAC